MEETGGLQSMGLQRIGHKLSDFTFFSLGLKPRLCGFRGEDDTRTVKAEGRNGSQLGRETGARLWRSEAETTFNLKGLL